MYIKNVKSGETYTIRPGDKFVSLSLLWIDIDVEPSSNWGTYDEIKDPVSGTTWPLHRKHLDKLKPGYQIVKNTVYPLVVANGASALEEATHIFYWHIDGYSLSAGASDAVYLNQIGRGVETQYAKLSVSGSSGVTITARIISPYMWLYGFFTSATSGATQNNKYGDTNVPFIGFADVLHFTNNDATNAATINYWTFVSVEGPAIEVKP